MYTVIKDWSIYVPPYNEREILMTALAINGSILMILSTIERNIYKFSSIFLLGLTGILYWSEANPSAYRDTIKILDQCNIFFSVIIHILYFKYYIQYFLILLTIYLFILENIYPHIWFIFHIYIYLCLLIIFLSTYYEIVYK